METIIQMVWIGTGGEQNDKASIDIPSNARITGLSFHMEAGLNAADEFSNAELSFISTNQINTNDARGIIASGRCRMGLLGASGGGITQVNFFTPMDIEVSGGERLHGHLKATAGVTTLVTVLLHLADLTGVRRAARRTTR